MGFAHKVLEKASLIPEGKVSTYKEIASSLGNPGLSRAVGNALNKNPGIDRIPCFRVVRSDGKLGGYSRGTKLKAEKLRAEGMEIEEGRIKNLDSVLYKFPR